MDGSVSNVIDLLDSARRETAEALRGPGDWLTGAQRIEVWQEVRDAATNELDRDRLAAISPEALDRRHGAGVHLDAVAVDVVHRVASDPGRLTRRWADEAIAELGEETYTELVAVTAIATVLDRFDLLLGEAPAPLPAPRAGAPTRVRPDGVGDVGAWVSQSIEKARANVSRAVSLVPETQATWSALVTACYSRGAEFMNLTWNRALGRAQVELVAARTTALNECFY